MPLSPRIARLVSALCAVVIVAGAAPAAAAVSTTLIEGSGSSGASNAVQQWIADSRAQGSLVVYTASGSATGRRDFRLGTNDFAVSDIGFQGRDPLTGTDDTAGSRPYGYLPIVAGGTSFPYQIRVGGQLVRSLRLSGETIAKIFTNVITNWNDPQITADNNGRKLPSLAIIPVVHSEGSGATFQFTRYLARQYPASWSSWAGRAAATEYYPATKPGAASNIVSQNGSTGVINFVTAASANGAIGYDEYSYALNANYPVAKVGNAAGYFTGPTAFNVAVSLTQALVDADPTSPTYLTANLDRVYTFTDPRTYPLSGYTYLILPTGTNAEDSRMTTGRRQALVDFLHFALCAGQRETAALGYAPLPINLVEAGFDQLRRLHSADPGVDTSALDIAGCDNPTFGPADAGHNLLVEIAPLPPGCDAIGQGPCGTGTTAPAGVPVDARDDTAPYAGSLSLRVAVGDAVRLDQLDPTTTGGHPAQATDPTGHRHAWVFAGDLGGIAVVDTRPSQPGWNVSGQATALANGQTVIDAQNLGWQPVLATGSDAEGQLSAGPAVDPSMRSPSSQGLGTAQKLAAADPGSGLGTQNLGAHLQLWIPDTSPSGDYRGTLTLTLISA